MVGGILQAIGWAFLPFLVWPIVNLIWGRNTKIKSFSEALIIMLGASATLLAGQHVRVDIFFSRMTDIGKACVDLIGFYLLLVPACILLTWNAQSFVGFAWAIREGSSEADGIRGVYILKTLIPIFAISMVIQGLAIATRAAMALNGQTRPARPKGIPPFFQTSQDERS